GGPSPWTPTPRTAGSSSRSPTDAALTPGRLASPRSLRPGRLPRSADVPDAPSGRRPTSLIHLTSGQHELLRWIGLTTMVVDHVGAILLPAHTAVPLRAVGRVAWPIFAFLLAYNVARRGVDPRRYLVPLLAWCAVAALPHYLAFDRFVVNILGTLFLGAVA